MKYRDLGNTGIKVSEIGMGCEGFVDKSPEQVKEIVDVMENNGVNTIDLYTPNPQVRSDLGKALAGRREKFVLQGHICAAWLDGQYKRTRKLDEVKVAFEDQLERLGTDYLDIGMIHYVDSMADWKEVYEGDVMKYAISLKNDGRIKTIGLSSHNPEVGIAAVESGLIDVLMFSINPCYDLMAPSEDVEQLWAEENYKNQLVNMEPHREKLYELCQSRGIGITVMKAFGGGDLLDASLSPAGVALTANQCINYALTRPAVATVMSGARTIDDLLISIAYESATDEEKDYAKTLASMPKISWEGHCMYCNHCAPCPSKIDIAAVTKFLNLTIAQGEVPETVREHYAVLEHKAGQCIQCGACEGRCPFNVKIIENMEKAKEVFGC